MSPGANCVSEMAVPCAGATFAISADVVQFHAVKTRAGRANGSNTRPMANGSNTTPMAQTVNGSNVKPMAPTANGSNVKPMAPTPAESSHAPAPSPIKPASGSTRQAHDLSPREETRAHNLKSSSSASPPTASCSSPEDSTHVGAIGSALEPLTQISSTDSSTAASPQSRSGPIDAGGSGAGSPGAQTLPLQRPAVIFDHQTTGQILLEDVQAVGGAGGGVRGEGEFVWDVHAVGEAGGAVGGEGEFVWG